MAAGRTTTCFDSELGEIRPETRAGSNLSVFVMSSMEEFEISSIIEACKCMESDKITERRKSAETLARLLSNQTYVSILDDNTDSNYRFGWNDIFKAAKTYMDKVFQLNQISF